MNDPSRPPSGSIAALVSGTAIFLAGCCTIPAGQAAPQSAFATPVDTAATFCDAFRCERADLEYRCLAEELKERVGITRQSYGIAREQIIDQNPGLRMLRLSGPGDAKFTGTDRARVPLECFWIDTVVLDLVRQYYFEAFGSDMVTVVEGFISGEEAERLTSAGGQGLAVLLDIAPHATLSEITGVRVGHEWKVSGFGGEAPAQ